MGNQTSQLLPKDPDFAKFVHFSPIEIREWSNTFKMLFPNGKMTLKDLEDFYSKLFPFGKVNSFCRRLFQNINISQSTQIDINELLIAFTILFKGSPFEKLRWIFRFYDFDNDGVVSKEDLGKGLSIVNEMVSNAVFTELDSKKLADEIFLIVQNQSGFLTLNDFEIIASNYPEKLKKISFL